MLAAVKRYYRLTKPGIVYGNLFHAVVGLLFAHWLGLSLWNSMGVVIGVVCVVASACVANNLLDRTIDKQMARTKKRALVTGEIDTYSAVLFSLILLTIGVVVLYRMTNVLTLVLGLVAYVWYVWIYGGAKRTTWLSTLIGTVPGALPAMAGYTAISGHLDSTAWLLFWLVVFWQMPHFYAIALYRQKEYKAARLPVVSLVLSRSNIYWQMVGFTALYIASILALIWLHSLYWVAGALLLSAAVYWLVTIVRGRHTLSDTWARLVFRQSLLLTIVLMIVAIVNVVLA